MLVKEALQFIESAEMRKYLEQTADQVRFSQWCNLIAKSRAGLADKISVLREIAAKYPSDEFCDPAAMADDAERALELTKSSAQTTVFFLSSYWRENQDQPPESVEDGDLKWHLINNDTCCYNAEVYHTFEHVIQGISEHYDCDDAEPVNDSWLWNEVARYDLSPEGKLEEVIRYAVGESGIIWGYEWADDAAKNPFSLLDDLLLPTPFQPGDIITVDCRPFDKIYHAVVLDNHYPNDCCAPFCVYFKSCNRLDTGALKHIHRSYHYPIFSPLLRAAALDGELPDYEAPLKLISEKIGQDPACIRLICDYFDGREPWERNHEIFKEILKFLDTIK